MKKYGAELAEQIKNERKILEVAIERRAERIANWETDEEDTFMSQRVEEQGIYECNLKLQILEGDGFMETEVVLDENDNEVRVNCVHTRYGWKYVGNNIWAASMKALLKKTGWRMDVKRVPAWVKFVPGGSGMYGVYTGRYEVVPWHTNMVTGEYFGF